MIANLIVPKEVVRQTYVIEDLNQVIAAIESDSHFKVQFLYKGAYAYDFNSPRVKEAVLLDLKDRLKLAQTKLEEITK